MMPRLTRFAVALGLIAGLCAGASACGGSGQQANVTVIVPWATNGTEYNAFAHIADQFAASHHFQVTMDSTPDFAEQLETDAATGNLPDLVDLPSPGAVEQYERKPDGLKRLAINLGSYDQPWRSLAESSSGQVYAVPVKADIKSLIWYKKGTLPGTTWAALENISRSGTPWCLGLENETTSGWPGADWVADILLSRYGAGAYESWLDGAWTQGKAGDAWQAWGTLIRYGAGVPGNALTALETPFGSAIDTKGCELEHGALSATGLRSTAGYSYELFPSMSGQPAPILVSGDFMGLFTANPYARSLLEYLATATAQKAWVEQPGYAFSADSKVVPGDYPGGVERGIANLLRPENSRTLCFSAEDIMPPDLSTAFENAILQYVYDHNLLDGLLSSLQTTANGVQGAGESRVVKNACA
jgi:alpha-glucoside transport system substrate-binding protein